MLILIYKNVKLLCFVIDNDLFFKNIILKINHNIGECVIHFR